MNRRGLLCGLFAAPVAPLAALLPEPSHDGNLITWEGIKSKLATPTGLLWLEPQDDGSLISFEYKELDHSSMFRYRIRIYDQVRDFNYFASKQVRPGTKAYKHTLEVLRSYAKLGIRAAERVR